VSGQLHRPAALTLGTYFIGGWVDPKAGLHNIEEKKLLILPRLELRLLGRPAHSSRNTDCAIPAPNKQYFSYEMLGQGNEINVFYFEQ
jgi:hypothetical protein